MQRASWIRRAGWLAALAMLVFAVAVSRADDPRASRGRPLGVPPKDLIDDTRIIEVRHDAPKGDHARYYLGVKLTGVSKALDEQLQLGGQGALVVAITKDGPAEKAGLEVHDVVTAVGDAPIKKFSDVAEAVEKSEGKELSLKVVRAGKPLDLAITPVERYGASIAHARPKPSTDEDEEVELELDLDQLEKTIRDKLKNAGVDVRMQLIRPGRFVPRGFNWTAGKPLDFPDDLSLVLRKQGKKPAEIEVTQGDKSWKVSENQLDELPDDVRKHIEPYLGHGPSQFSVTLPGGKKLTVPVPPTAPPIFDGDEVRIPLPDVQTRERVRGALEHRIDELSREMERMRDRVESLRHSLHEELERTPQREGDK